MIAGGGFLLTYDAGNQWGYHSYVRTGSIFIQGATSYKHPVFRGKICNLLKTFLGGG